MAGGRSKGCNNCKKRKIKCDQNVPTCRRCEKSGLRCDGLSSMFRYVNAKAESPKLPEAPVDLSGTATDPGQGSSSYQQNLGVEFGTSQVQEPPFPQDWATPATSEYSRDNSNSESYLFDDYFHGFGMVNRLPQNETELLGWKFVDRLQSSAGTGRSLDILGSLATEIPSRIGYSRSLDTSLDHFLSAHDSIGQQSPMSDEKSRQKYSRALGALQSDLNAPDETLITQTLCAASILSMYEMVMPVAGKSAWIAHSGGVNDLFKACGTAMLQSTFGKKLFFAQVPPIVTRALMTDTESFLESDEWKSLLNDLSFLEDPGDIVYARLLRAYAKLPSLFRRSRKNSKAPTTETSTTNQRDLPITLDLINLKMEVGQIGAEIDAFVAQDPTKMWRVPSKQTFSPFPEVYWFGHFELARSFGLYWRVVVMLHTLLEHEGVYIDSNGYDRDAQMTAARNICMSVEYGLAQPPFGPVLVVPNLPVAHSVLRSDESLNAWILHNLSELCNVLPLKTKHITRGYLAAVRL